MKLKFHRQIPTYSLCILWCILSRSRCSFALSHRTSTSHKSRESLNTAYFPYDQMTRKGFVEKSKLLLGIVSSSLLFSNPASALTTGSSTTTRESSTILQSNRMLEDNARISIEMEPTGTKAANEIAYRSLSLQLQDFGVTVPVACWYPSGNDNSESQNQQITNVRYEHRISVKRIGQLLAGWDFIPEFASRNFELNPSTATSTVLDGVDIPFPTAATTKVVLLAHGYLGSRFDLSHLAEELAQKGFVCLSPEYPESLAASYPRLDGLDRSEINNALLQLVEQTIPSPKSYGIVGHSLGCGTALKTGDNSWARVLIAGRPPADPLFPILFVSSTNDGTVRFGGGNNLSIPNEYEVLQENDMPRELPKRAALVFSRPDAPNHISYLAEGVNDAMIDLLSPLLPVAQALSIPVLDFDKYKESQDSKQTATIMKPLVSNYLLQQMSSSDSR